MLTERFILGFQSLEEFKQYIIQTERGRTCSLCHLFSHRSEYNVKLHIESKHFPNSFSWACAVCAMNFGTKMALDKHMTQHRNKPRN